MIMYYILGAIVLITLAVVVFLIVTFSKETPGNHEVKIEPLINNDFVQEKRVDLERQLKNAVSKEEEFKKKIEELEDELRGASEKSLDNAQENIAKLDALSEENRFLKERILKEENSSAGQFSKAQEEMQALNQENASLKLQLQDAILKCNALEAKIAGSKEQMEGDLIKTRELVGQLKAERDAFITNRESSQQSVSMLTREFEEIKKSNESLLVQIEILRSENQKFKESIDQMTHKNQLLQYDLTKYRAQASGLEKICENYKLQLAAKVRERMRLMLMMGIVLLFNGCAVIDGTVEVSRTIWGSSTRALEKARAEAITKTYDKSYWDVVRPSEKFCNDHFSIFNKDEVKGYIIVIGVKGSVNTTEVGIFFVEVNDGQTRVEVSSLSTNAKRIVSRQLFHELDILFGLIPPDLVIPQGANQEIKP